MAKLTEDDTAWTADVYQIETTDPVVGGPPNPTTGAGMSNIPHVQLANRTAWLRKMLLALNLGQVADTATRLAMTAAERVKLAGIASGATKNATDAELRDRATHNGTQTQSTIVGLIDALANKAALVHAHTIAQITGLQAALNGKADDANLAALMNIAWTTANSPRDFSGDWSFQLGPSGAIIKVAAITTSDAGPAFFTFEDAFPNNCKAVFMQDRAVTGGTLVDRAHRLSVISDSVSKTGFQAFAVSPSDAYAATAAYYLAIGN